MFGFSGKVRASSPADVMEMTAVSVSAAAARARASAWLHTSMIIR